MRAPAALVLLVLMVFGAVVALDVPGEQVSATHLTAPTVATPTATESTILLSWDAVSFADAGYKVRWRVSGSGTSYSTADIASGTTSYTIQSLTGGTTYEVQVGGCQTSYSDCGKFTTLTVSTPAPANAPTSVAASARTLTSLTFGWTAPSDVSHTNYFTRYRKSGTTNWTTASSSITGTSREITGLEFHPYDLAVRACTGTSNNNDDCSIWVSTVNVHTTPPKLTIRSGALTATRTDTIPVLWTKIAFSDGSEPSYHVRSRVSSQPSWTTPSTTLADSGNDKRVSLTGLSANTDYEIQVRARAGGQNGDWSDSITVGTKPEKPSNRRFDTPGARSITFRWDGDADRFYYILRQPPDDSQPRSDGTSVGTNKEYTASGLTPNTQYQLWVRACNLYDGIENCTSFADVKATTSTAAPSAPRNLDADGGERVGIDDGKIRLSWDAPAHNHGAAISGYTIESRQLPSGTWQSVGTTGASVRTIDTIQFPDNQSYALRVRATNSIGGGDNAEITVSNRPSGPSMSAPSGADLQTTGVRLSWTAPSTGTPVTSYEYGWKLASEAWSDASSGSTPDGTTTFASISGLTQSTNYDFRVRALTTHRTGFWTTVSATTAAPVALKITDLTWELVDTNGVSLTSNGRNVNVRENAGEVVINLIASFNRQPATDDHLSVSAYVDVSSSNDLSANFSTLNNGGFTMTRAICGESYWDSTPSQCRKRITVTVTQDQIDELNERSRGWFGFTASAQGRLFWTASNNDARRSVDLHVVDDDTRPDPPIGFSAATGAAGAGQLNLTWTAPSDRGEIDGSAAAASAVSYDVQWKSGTQEYHNSRSKNVTTVGTTLTPPAGGDIAYDVQVRARTAAGASSWVSASGTSSTSAPSAPARPSVTRGSGDGFTLTWVAPHNGGQAITGYDWEYTRYPSRSNPNWTRAGVGASVTSVSSSIDGLATTAMVFRVRAKNAHGAGAWSPNIILATVPDPPTVTISNSGDSVRFRIWNPGNDGGRSLHSCAANDFQYRQTLTSQWKDLHPNCNTARDGTAPDHLFSARSLLRIRVRNDIGYSAWGLYAFSTGGSMVNSAPSFTDGATTTREMSDTLTTIGDPVAATDGNSDVLRYSLEGTDAGKFDISATTGQISKKSGVTYDQGSYSVVVRVRDGILEGNTFTPFAGSSDTITVTILPPVMEATGVSGITITNATVAESAGTVNVEVLIMFNGRPPDGTDLGLVADLVGLAQGATTASRPADFTARQYFSDSGARIELTEANCGTTEWAANQCRLTIPVTIVQDAVDESDERLNITAAFIKVLQGNMEALDPAHTERAVLTITDDDTKASAPQNLSANASDSVEGQVSLTWGQPTNQGVLNGSNYLISTNGYQYRYANTQNGLDSATWTDSSTTDAQVNDLEPGTWWFEVRAKPGVTNNETARTSAGVNDPRGVTISTGSVSFQENGGSSSYTIKLDTQPTGNVTVTPSSGNTNVATVSGALTFTPSDWSTPKTVTVTGVDDDVDNAGEKRATTITHSVSGGDYGGVSAASVSVEVRDDDADPTVTLALSPNPVTEGQSSTVTATLNRASGGATTVTVSATAADADDFTLSANKVLTIPAGQLSSTGSVTIAANQDDDSADESVTVSGSATNSEGISGPASVTLGITDDDMVGLTVTSSGAIVFENVPAGRDLFTVKLNTQPSDTVVVDVSSSNTSSVTVSPNELTFTTGNWNDAQTVKALPVSDDNAVDELLTIRFAINQAQTLDNDYDSVTDQTRPLTAKDDDAAQIQLSTNTLTVNEGSTNTYTVKLTAQPTGNVVVDVVSPDPNAASVNPTSLTFTSGNWNTARTVTVTGVHDGDDDGETVTVTNRVNNAQSANEFDGESETVSVSVTDDDTQLAAPDFSLAAGDGEIVVTWQTVTGATSYQIAWQCGSVDSSAQVSTSPYTITDSPNGLPNGTQCDVTMQSIGTQNGPNLDSGISASQQATPVSDNNDLSALTVSEGSLSPGFSAGTTSYTVMVGYGMSTITVTATAAEPAASVQILVGSTVQTGAITLAQGSTTITVRVTSQLGSEQDYTIVVTRATNQPPQFDSNAPMSISFNENTPGNTNIGNPVSATDSDGGTITYTLEGTDPGSFEIDGGTGQISTKSITYDHEAKDTYSVTVKASDGQGGSSTRVVEITVDDVAEPPPAPDAPMVAAASTMGHTSLDVSWSAPDTDGVPPITDYDVEYKVQSETQWEDWTFAGTGVMTTITGLMPGVNYDVRVGATNDEGGPTWSDSRFGATASNQAPAFATQTATRSITETPAGTVEADGGRNVDVAVTASDGNDDTLTYALSGDDASSFTIDNNGQIKTVGGQHYDREDKATYTVVVTATDPFDEDDSITVTITFTNVAEAASVPQNVQLTAGVDNIKVDWDASTNAGGYIVQWKSGGQAYSDTQRRHEITDGSTTTYTIPNLDPDTEYDVQVTATRDESENSAASMEESATPLSALSVSSITRENLSEDNANVGGFTLSLNRALVAGETAIITYTISYGTASAADITSASQSEVGSNQTHTMTAGDREFTVNLRAVNDNLYEGTTAETINVNVTRVQLPGNPNATFTSGPGTVSIADNDAAPTEIRVTLTPDTVTEQGGSQSVTVKAELWPTGSGTLPSNTLVTFTVAGDTAQSADFNAITGLTVTITSGDRSAMRTQPFNPVNDIIAEGDETVTFTASETSSGLSLSGTATLTITDDETPGVHVSEDTLNVAEGDGSQTYQVRLNAQPTGNVVINITAPSALTVSPNSLTFSAGNYNVEQTVTVTAAGDSTDDDETHTIMHAVDAGSASAYVGVTIDSVMVQSYETRRASITGARTVGEGDSASLTITLDPAAPTDVSVRVNWRTSTAGSTAIGGTGSTRDFTTQTGFVTFAGGESTKMITVTTRQDERPELDETFRVCLELPDDATDGVSIHGTDNCATVTIEDDDDPVLTIDTPMVDEGDDGESTTMTFTVTLDPPGDRTVSVRYSRTAGSATSGTDYDAITAETLTFQPNQTSKTIPVTVRGDITNENDETIVLTFNGLTNAVFESNVANRLATGTIKDDDPRPTIIQLSVESGSLSESQAPIAQTITLRGTFVNGNAVETATNVTISVAGDGATEGTDYTLGAGPYTLTIPADATSGTTTVQITPLDDIDADAGESVRFFQSGSSGFTVTPVSLTIGDNDLAETSTTLSLSGSGTVSEGGRITLTVTLGNEAGPTNGPTRITIQDTSDFTANATERTIPAGGTSTSFVLTAVDDQTDEPDRTIDVTVGVISSNLDNVHPPDTAARLTITDNDPTPEIALALSRTTITESSGPNNSATVTATMNRPSSAATTITVTAAIAPNQEATALPADFMQSGTTLTIPAGSLTSSGVVSIAAAEDDDSLDERIDVSATATNNHAAGAISNLRLTIEDNDTPGITLTELSPINEGGTQEYTVVLNVAPSADVVVRVSPSSASGVTVDLPELTFTPTTWNQPRTVTVTGEQDDDAVDDHGTITHSVIGGRSASEYRSAPSATLDVSVSDDDRAGFTITPTSLDIDEGDSETFTVVLTAAPARGSVRISLVSDNTESVTVSPSSVSFSAGNWDSPRTVTVRGRQDANPVSETVTITASVVDASSSDEFDDVGEQMVTVNVSDDETTNYDSDGDGLIEIHTIEQLNAVRYDLDGNGQVAQSDEAAYSAAFSNPENGVVCPTGTTCEGYELFGDLAFGPDTAWTPIGDNANPYNADFDGNGHSIANLSINSPSTDQVGLFGVLASGKTIRNVGLLHVDISGGHQTGALVGRNLGAVESSYVTGSVSGTTEVGALVGRSAGSVDNTYAVGSVSGAGNNVGGLVGWLDGSGSVRNSYVSVALSNTVTNTAGLVGWVASNDGVVENSYYDTDVSPASVFNNVNNLRHGNAIRFSGGNTATVNSVDGKTGAELRSGAGGIYSNWSAATWDFGSELQFPALKVDSTRDADQAATWQEFGVQLREWPTITQAAPSADLSEVNLGWTEIVDVWPDRATITYRVLRNGAEIASGLSQPFYDDDSVNSGPTYRYEVVVLLDGAEARRSQERMVAVNRDADGDGLIEITTQAQLDAVRYDLNGDGRVDDRENDDGFSPLASAGGSACPSGTMCTGYELSKDLTLSGNWTPIGGDVEPDDDPVAYTGVFEGNGNAIFGLRVSKADRKFVGLFGALGSGGEVRNIGVVGVSVTGRSTVGALVGRNAGTVKQAFATGSVTGNAVVGGLVGSNSGTVTASYSAAAVAGVTVTEGSDRATPSVLGGLVGRNAGTVSNAYATGSVTGHSLSGGLVGDNSGGGHITNSYATGAVSERDGFPHVGGLIGRQSGGPISASYWDTETSGRSNGAGQGDVDADLGKTTAQLQSPTTNTGIYAGWSATIWDFDDEDTDGDEYPSLIGLRGQRGDELTPPTRGTQTGTTTGSTGSGGGGGGGSGGGGGGGGGGQPQIVPVTVRAETPGELTLTVVAAGQGNVRLTINGRLLSVVVTTDEGSIGVRLVISASDDAINQLQALSFETETDQQIADAASEEFPIAGSQPIVTITLRGSGGQPITLLAEQATVCLPLSDETLEQAGTSPLSLLHFGDPSGWTPLSGSQIVEIEGVTLLCAETTEFSPFAIGIGAAGESEAEEAETVETVDEADSEEQPETVVLVETAPDCLRGALHRGFSLVLFGGGSAEQLSACLQRRGVEAAWTLEGGRYRAFGPLAPELVNRAFTGQFADAVPAMTPLWVAADEASDDAATAPLDWSGDNCFDRAPVADDNLVVFAGGSVSELAVCGLRHNVQTFYAFDEHGLVSYEFGRSEIRNGAFRSLFTEGLPAATPLIARVRTQDTETQTEQPAAESDDPAEPETEQPEESTGAEESGETDETASAEQKSAVRLGVIVNTGLVGVFHRDDCRVDAGITTRFGWLEGDAINIRRDGTGRCADWLYAQGPDGVESWVHSRYVDESGTAQPFAIAASDMTSAVVVNTAGQGVALRSDCRSEARLSRSGWSEGQSLTVLREGVGRCNGWVFALGPGPSWSWVHLRFLQRN